jgi:hypothetical protein
VVVVGFERGPGVAIGPADADQQVEVVAQEAVGEGVRYWRDIMGVEAEEVGVVAGLQKEVLAVVAPVIDMVDTMIEKGFGSCHLSQDWQSFKDCQS